MIGRTNTGGGGNLQATDALLRVQAPAGSTVTITKGAVTKSDAGHENADDHTFYDYYFIIHASQFDSINAWTVTATLGTDTASDTVIIDSADEYDVVLAFLLYLYKPADECTDTTGGWDNVTWLNNYTKGTLQTTYLDDRCRMTAPAGSYQVSAVTHNKINLTPYTKATVNLITYTFNGSGYHRFAVIDSQSGITNAVLYADVSRLGEITVDLTNITGEHYFGIYLSSQSGAGCVIDFNYVWLEV